MTNLQEAFRAAAKTHRAETTGSTSLKRKPRRIGRVKRRLTGSASVPRSFR